MFFARSLLGDYGSRGNAKFLEAHINVTAGKKACRYSPATPFWSGGIGRKCRNALDPKTAKINPRRTRAIIAAIFIQGWWFDRDGIPMTNFGRNESVRILKSARFVAQCAWLFAKRKKGWNTNRHRTGQSLRYSVALGNGRRICVCGLAFLPMRFRTCRLWPHWPPRCVFGNQAEICGC